MQDARAPRRRNAQASKTRILAAAQKVFCELGYSQTGIRDIAAVAEVSSTLLLRYYGSKAGLFEAALIDLMTVGEDVFGLDRARAGERLGDLLTERTADFSLLDMIALSMGDADARTITARVIDTHAIAPLAQWIGAPDARARATEIIMVSTGFTTYARQLSLAPLAPDEHARMAAWLKRTLQAIVDAA
jgi:AcrR family transcriptional regulator